MESLEEKIAACPEHAITFIGYKVVLHAPVYDRCRLGELERLLNSVCYHCCRPLSTVDRWRRRCSRCSMATPRVEMDEMGNATRSYKRGVCRWAPPERVGAHTISDILHTVGDCDLLIEEVSAREPSAAFANVARANEDLRRATGRRQHPAYVSLRNAVTVFLDYEGVLCKKQIQL